MFKRPLTPKQLRLLRWIEAYVRERGTMPTRREMAAGLGVSSVATIQQHVEALEQKGFLHLREGEFRGVELSRQWEKARESLAASSPAAVPTVPLLGRVAAGFPIEVFSTEERLRVPEEMRGGGKRELFALRVQGDSMIGEGILSGDLVFCEKTETARNGEVVVALLNGEATLKTFQKTSEGVSLLPANPQYPVLRVREGDVLQIQGILTGVVRTYGAAGRT